MHLFKLFSYIPNLRHEVKSVAANHVVSTTALDETHGGIFFFLCLHFFKNINFKQSIFENAKLLQFLGFLNECSCWTMNLVKQQRKKHPEKCLGNKSFFFFFSTAVVIIFFPLQYKRRMMIIKPQRICLQPKWMGQSDLCAIRTFHLRSVHLMGFVRCAPPRFILSAPNEMRIRMIPVCFYSCSSFLLPLLFF